MDIYMTRLELCNAIYQDGQQGIDLERFSEYLQYKTIHQEYACYVLSASYFRSPN